MTRRRRADFHTPRFLLLGPTDRSNRSIEFNACGSISIEMLGFSGVEGAAHACISSPEEEALWAITPLHAYHHSRVLGAWL